MKPIWLIGGLVVVAIIAAVLIFSGGGTPTTDTPTTTTTTPSTNAQTPASQPPTQQPAGNAAGFRADLDAWIASVADAGLVVTYGSVSGSDTAATVDTLAIGEPTDPFAWTFTAARLRVEPTANRLTIAPSGTGTLAVTLAGTPTTRQVTATAMQIAAAKNADGRITTITVNISGLSIAGGAAPVTTDDIEIVLTRAAGEGAVPAGSGLTLAIDGLVVPSATDGPLGKTIPRVNADLTLVAGLPTAAPGAILAAWQAAESPITVNRLAIDWGLLHLTGMGSLGIDDAGRPTGTLAVRLTNPLAALDAFHAFRHYDPPMVGQYYAVLLDDYETENPPALTITITDGNIILRDEVRGLDGLVLGTVAPLLPTAP